MTRAPRTTPPLVAPGADGSVSLPVGACGPSGWVSAVVRARRRGVGAQPDGEDQGSQPVGGAGQEERSGQVRDAEGFAEGAGGCGEVRADDAAEGGGDQDGGDGAGAVGGGGEVGSGVTGLEVGGRPRAVDEQRDEKQDGLVEDGGGDDTGGADRAGEVSGGESGASSLGLGYPADSDGGQGAPGGEQGAGQSGQAGGAEHVLGEEGADGDPGGQARAAEDLGDDQDGQDAALCPDGVGPGGCRAGGFKAGHLSPGQTGQAEEPRASVEYRWCRVHTGPRVHAAGAGARAGRRQRGRCHRQHRGPARAASSPGDSQAGTGTGPRPLSRASCADRRAAAPLPAEPVRPTTARAGLTSGECSVSFMASSI